MKRIISVICMFAVVVSAFCVPVNSADQNSSITLEVSSVADMEVVLDLCVYDAKALGIKSFGVFLNFPSNATFLGCEFVRESGTGTKDFFVMPGIPYQILWTENGDSIGNEKAVIAKLTFLTSSVASEVDLNVSLVLDGANLPKDASGNNIADVSVSGVEIVDGVVPTPPEDDDPPVVDPPEDDDPPVVDPPEDDDPPVVDPPEDDDPPVVDPPEDDDPPVVDPPEDDNPPVVDPPVDDNPPVVDPPVDEGVPGDADDSGSVNLSDVSLILQHIAKWNVTLNQDNADVTGDGAINLSDVSLILKYIAKWDVELK